MNDPYDSFKASHMYFDPQNEPRLPFGDWGLLAALVRRGGGGSPAAGPAASDRREMPASDEATWDPPKFDEPRTIPGGWDVSSFLK